MGANDSLPPLAKSDYFSEDKIQLTASIAKGIRGQITVNGKTYDGIMPALPMKDKELAAVSTYVLNMFDNKGGEITVEENCRLPSREIIFLSRQDTCKSSNMRKL